MKVWLLPAPLKSVSYDEVRAEFPEAAYRILLSHRPEVAEEKVSSGYELVLAGHTHGGQFFPWTIVAWLDHKYFVGLYERDGGHVYVNPGTGSWGPLLRLGTTPEITLLRLVRTR